MQRLKSLHCPPPPRVFLEPFPHLQCVEQGMCPWPWSFPLQSSALGFGSSASFSEPPSAWGTLWARVEHCAGEWSLPWGRGVFWDFLLGGGQSSAASLVSPVCGGCSCIGGCGCRGQIRDQRPADGCKVKSDVLASSKTLQVSLTLLDSCRCKGECHCPWCARGPVAEITQCLVQFICWRPQRGDKTRMRYPKFPAYCRIGYQSRQGVLNTLCLSLLCV